MTTQAGWYADPELARKQRYWDGAGWGVREDDYPLSQSEASQAISSTQTQPAPATWSAQNPGTRPTALRWGGHAPVLVALGGAAFAAIGCLGTWASATGLDLDSTDAGDGLPSLKTTTQSVTGLHLSQGVLVLALAVIVGGFAAVRLTQPARWATITALVLAAFLAIGGGVGNMSHIQNVATNFSDGTSVSIGWGLWLVLIGGIAATAALIWDLVTLKNAQLATGCVQ